MAIIDPTDQRALRNRERRLSSDILVKKNQFTVFQRDKEELDMEKRKILMKEKRLLLEKQELEEDDKKLQRKVYELKKDIKCLEKEQQEAQAEIKNAT